MNFGRTWIALALCGAAGIAQVGCSSDDSSDGKDKAVDSGTDNATGSGSVDGGGSGSKPSIDGSTGKPSGEDASVSADGASAPGNGDGQGDTDAGNGGGGGGGGGDDAGATGSADAGAKTCGTRNHPETCKANEYCAYPVAAQCGAADQGGQCTRKPTVCPQDIVGTGVCGCDGKTYGNECMAESAGSSVAHNGECTGGTDGGAPTTGGQGEGKTCAGIAGLKCASGLFCDFAVGCDKNVADAAGKCTRIPTQCGPDAAQQVCGCDGKSYKNLCEANMQSVSVDHTGTCK